MRLILLTSILMLLVGCSTIDTQIRPPKIDSYLLEPCAKVLPTVEKFNSFQEVLVQKARERSIEVECYSKQRALADSIKNYQREFNNATK